MSEIEEQIAAIDKETQRKLGEIFNQYDAAMRHYMRDIKFSEDYRRHHAHACRVLNLGMQNATPPPRTTIEQRRDSAKLYASQVRSRKPEMQVKKINQPN